MKPNSLFNDVRVMLRAPGGPKAKGLGLGYHPTSVNCLEMGIVDQLVDSQAQSLAWGKWAQHRDEKLEQQAKKIKGKESFALMFPQLTEEVIPKLTMTQV